MTDHSYPSVIRVMRIIARLNIGGPAIHVTLLTSGLQDDTFASKLVAGQIGEMEGDMSYLTHSKGISPSIIPSLGREISIWDDLQSLWALIRLIREFRPHILHTHTAKAGFVGRLAGWLCGVPVIVHTFHGHVFHGYFGAMKTTAFIWLERGMAMLSDAILTVSARLKNELLAFRIAPASQIHVIPLGLDLQPLVESGTLRGEFREELGISPSVHLFGIIGRLVPIKNHSLFLAAARQLILEPQLPPMHFVIVGDGEERIHIERLIMEYGLQDKVSLTGWRNDLARVYADLDTLVLTSLNEGTPVSLIEAIAAGVPVIATSVGGVPDVLEDGRYGILVTSGDIVHLTHAMKDLLFGKKSVPVADAQSAIINHYGYKRLLVDIRNLYLDLLRRKGIAVEIIDADLRL